MDTMTTTPETCIREGCTERKAGRSKYCKTHRSLARAAWREKVGIDAALRDARYDEFKAAWCAAVEAGLAAGKACKPVGMRVFEADLAGKELPGGQSWDVPEGTCGFAWVTVYPGNCSFALWAKKHAGWSKPYDGGMQYWVSAFGQSSQRKDAFAEAAAAVLRERLGLKCYAGGRLD